MTILLQGDAGFRLLDFVMKGKQLSLKAYVIPLAALIMVFITITYIGIIQWFLINQNSKSITRIAEERAYKITYLLKNEIYKVYSEAIVLANTISDFQADNMPRSQVENRIKAYMEYRLERRVATSVIFSKNAYDNKDSDYRGSPLYGESGRFFFSYVCGYDWQGFQDKTQLPRELKRRLPVEFRNPVSHDLSAKLRKDYEKIDSKEWKNGRPLNFLNYFETEAQITDRPGNFYHKVMKSGEERIISPQFVYFAESGINHQVLTISIPIYSLHDELIGVLAIDININFLGETINTYYEAYRYNRLKQTYHDPYTEVFTSGGICVVNKYELYSGRPVDYDYSLLNKEAETRNNFSYSDQYIQRIHPNEQFQISHTIENQSLLAFGIVEDLDFPDTEWLIVSHIPRTQIYKPVNIIRSAMIIAGIFSLIIAAVYLFFLVEKLALGPLRKLIQASNEQTKGNFKARASFFKIREFNELSKAFNNMTARTSNLITELRMTIKKQKETQQALKASEEHLRITLQSIGDAVIVTDETGSITVMNTSAHELTGWPIEKAFGKKLSDVFYLVDPATEERLPDLLETVFSRLVPVNLKEAATLVAFDGSKRKIDDSIAPIIRPNGSVAGAVLVFRDVTERLKIKEDLQQAQKMDSIGQLAGGIAHDFNNMLTGILGSATLLEDSIKTENEKKYYEIIINTIKRAIDLTGKLLAFSHKGKMISTKVDIHKIIEDATVLLSSSTGKNIVIRKKFCAEESFTLGDPTQIENAVLNVGINSRDAMKEGGSIDIGTEHVYLPPDYCEKSPFDIDPGDYVKIRILDTGPGMNEYQLGRIFEPFYTTKTYGRGTGLGLSAVYSTVQDHSGALSVKSEPGKGTTFTMYFPLAAGYPREETPRIQAAARATRTFLVIDDESIIRTTAQGILQKMGHSSITAPDGKTGLEILQQRFSDIDIIILDILMPGMNGREVYKKIRELSGVIPVLLSSGYTQQTELDTFLEHTASWFLAKPFTPESLANILESAFSQIGDK